MALFSKPKGWGDLSETSKEWAKGINKKNAGEALAEAASSGSSSYRLEYLLKNYSFDRTDVQVAITSAVKATRLTNLKTLLTRFRRPEIFTKEGFTYSSALPGILECAAKTRDLGIWGCLMDACVGYKFSDSSPNTLQDFLRVAMKADWADGCNYPLTNLNASGYEMYREALRSFAKSDDASFGHILGQCEKFKHRAENLAHALGVVAECGSVEKTRMLLDAGVNPNAQSGYALRRAVECDKPDIIDTLVAAGADLTLFGHEILQELRPECSRSACYLYFEELVRQTRKRAQLQTAVEGAYSITVPGTLAQTQPLPDGGNLTILFNFTLAQQMVLTDKANAVVHFDDVPRAALDHAREAYRKLSGVFPDEESAGGLFKQALDKPGLRMR